MPLSEKARAAKRVRDKAYRERLLKNNPDFYQEQYARFRERMLACSNASNVRRRRTIEGVVIRAMIGIKNRHKTNGYGPTNLTKNDLLQIWHQQKGVCALTGVDMYLGVKGLQPSLDRIDSKQGYVVGNVQWVCWTVNNFKSDWSEHDLLVLCKTILDHARRKARRLKRR